jgi:hypothetical protein
MAQWIRITMDSWHMYSFSSPASSILSTRKRVRQSWSILRRLGVRRGIRTRPDLLWTAKLQCRLARRSAPDRGTYDPRLRKTKAILSFHPVRARTCSNMAIIELFGMTRSGCRAPRRWQPRVRIHRISRGPARRHGSRRALGRDAHVSPILSHAARHEHRPPAARIAGKRPRRAGGGAAQAEECCGFGGIFSMEHPELSAEWLKRKISNLESSQSPTLVVTEPIGHA